MADPILRTSKIKIYPNAAAREQLEKMCRARRAGWNFYLSKIKDQHEDRSFGEVWPEYTLYYWRTKAVPERKRIFDRETGETRWRYLTKDEKKELGKRKVLVVEGPQDVHTTRERKKLAKGKAVWEAAKGEELLELSGTMGRMTTAGAASKKLWFDDNLLYSETKKMLREHHGYMLWWGEFHSHVVGGKFGAFAKAREAWDRCFKGEGGEPRYQSKRSRQFGFTVQAGPSFMPDDRHVRIPMTHEEKRNIGPLLVRTAESIRHLREAGKRCKTLTFTRDDTGSWYMSVSYETEPKRTVFTDKLVGVDWGVKRLATTSDGRVYDPIPLASERRRLASAQRRQARHKPGSQRWLKLKQRIAKIHRKIERIRSHHLHVMTAQLTETNLAIEDLNVQGMSKSAKGTADAPGKNVKQKAALNRKILDHAPARMREMLEYKSQWKGTTVVAVNPAYTSQRCPQCGHTAKENRPTQALFSCTACGFCANADVVAARNIESLGRAVLEGGAGQAQPADESRQEKLDRSKELAV